jgi:uncharacterized membrane-anchored protein YjiN (DUF445 family)
MSTAVYSIRLESDVRRMMDEMSEVDWQAEIRQMVETMVRDKKKTRLLDRAEARWKEQVDSVEGAALMIREDRDASAR